jgi:hypothetical protein
VPHTKKPNDSGDGASASSWDALLKQLSERAAKEIRRQMDWSLMEALTMRPHSWAMDTTTCLDCGMSWADVVNSSSPLQECNGRMEDEELPFRRQSYDDQMTSYKCECGYEKIYGPETQHSTWCPKYK